MKIIAGTGHRPQFMPCKEDEQLDWAIDVKSMLLGRLILSKPDLIITGMARGFDTWIAEAAIMLNIPFYAYVPFKGQHLSWKDTPRERYLKILEKAKKVVFTSEHYSRECFHIRDRAMVDNSNGLYSLLKPDINKGGTYYTVNYCKNKYPEKPIKNFWL